MGRKWPTSFSLVIVHFIYCIYLFFKKIPTFKLFNFSYGQTKVPGVCPPTAPWAVWLSSVSRVERAAELATNVSQFLLYLPLSSSPPALSLHLLASLSSYPLSSYSFPLPRLYICLTSLSTRPHIPPSPAFPHHPPPPSLLISVAVGSLFKCSIGEGLRFMQGQCGMW